MYKYYGFSDEIDSFNLCKLFNDIEWWSDYVRLLDQVGAAQQPGLLSKQNYVNFEEEEN